MATNETQLERLIDVHDQTATIAGSVLVGSVDDFVAPEGVKQKRKSVWGIFREMPFLVKLGTLWLLFVLFSAIYAQLDAKSLQRVVAVGRSEPAAERLQPGHRRVRHG